MSISTWETRLYPSRASRDAVCALLSLLDEYARPDSQVLDLGAGIGRNSHALKGRVQRVVGVDLDPRVKENPLLDVAVVAEPGPLPFEDSSFDLVFAIYVLEHVDDPVALAHEVHRILKPGGLFLALTPNRYHYVSLIARLTPTSFHKWVNARRGIEFEDTFPTLYLMNTRRALRRLFTKGFDCVRMDTLEIAPNYLRFSTPMFILGALYERIVNRFSWLAALRVNILCVFEKT